MCPPKPLLFSPPPPEAGESGRRWQRLNLSEAIRTVKTVPRVLPR